MNKLVMKRKAKKAADYFFTYLLLIVIAIICAGPFICFPTIPELWSI